MFASFRVLAESAEVIDAVVLDEMAKQNIVGLAVGIVKDGYIYYARGYGHNDLPRTQPVTTDTIFSWASVSKTLTATAALMLDEQNPSFDIDDKVAKHVSYWPNFGRKSRVRIWHLLSHRAGITHYRKRKNCPDNRAPGYDRSKHISPLFNARQGVEVFINQPLCFEPGSLYKYSTFGYNLLASAVEGGAGTGYAAWIEDQIKKPLGMFSLRQAAGARTGFERRCHAWHEVVRGNDAWKLPGGGWESNIVDLAKFARALLRDDLLNNTRRLWTTVDGNISEHRNFGYGFGMMFTLDKNEVWHKGKNDTSRALLVLYPNSAERLGIVLMTNSVHSDLTQIAQRLAKLFGQTVFNRWTPVEETC